MITRVQSVDVGCEPSPSGSGEVLIQDYLETYLLFAARSKEVGERGFLTNLGVAVLLCKDCSASSFGYPNDEGLQEHPLYAHGIADCGSSFLEVVDSPWVAEMASRKLASARRIWGARQMDWEWAKDHSMRHFIVTLNEKTFECLASELRVEKFCQTYDEALAFVWQRFGEH
jgi:hypothetical protein